jgi:hypothetical protein
MYSFPLSSPPLRNPARPGPIDFSGTRLLYLSASLRSVLLTTRNEEEGDEQREETYAVSVSGPYLITQPD